MATTVSKLAGWCFTHKKTVVAIWIALLIVLGGALTQTGSSLSGGFTIPDTEAQHGIDILDAEFPEASGTFGQIVIRAPKGSEITAEPYRSSVLGIVQAANQLEGVIGATEPFSMQGVSPNQRYALINVQYKDSIELVSQDQIDAFATVGSDIAKQAGLTIAHGGEVTQEAVHVSAVEGVGVVVAFVVLTITLGSLVLAGMTMINALIGVGVSMLVLLLLSNSFEFNSTTPILALMLGLALSIDYSLFITSRHRTYLSEGMPAERAAKLSVGTAGTAVVFAGLTVIIALGALATVGVPFLGMMGLTAAFSVLVAVVVALTLLPAVLGIVGERAVKTRSKNEAVFAKDQEPFGYRWARWVIKHRIAVTVLSIAGLLLLAYPATDMRLGLPAGDTAPKDTGVRKAYDLTTSGFGAGTNGRLVIAVYSEDSTKLGEATERVAAAASQVSGVVSVAPPQTNQANTANVIGVVPRTGPNEKRTETVVHDLREQFAKLNLDESVDVALTGQTAMAIDISQTLRDALPKYLALVVLLSMLVLIIVFRSILVPLKATLGFLGSLLATFGVTVAVFQWGWLSSLVGIDTPGPLVSFLPILLIGILFGLAMDYEVFLATRMRESFVHGDSAQEAIVSGTGHGARVVTAAAIIMISVFSAFALNDDPIIKSMGFALALGVLIDAFIVRLLLVPAVMSLLDAKAWWIPKWLDRVVPSVDVEGSALESAATDLSDRES